MPDSIKEFLHDWCNQSRRTQPTYIITNQGLNGKRFICEVTVEGFNYTGYATSTDKQDAEIKAVQDLVKYMIRQNFIEKHLLEEFEKKGSFQYMDENQVNESNNSHDSISDDNESDIDNIDENQMEETTDGNWSLSNAKERLDRFMQQNKMYSEYNYKAVGPIYNRRNICEMTIYFKKLQRTLKACESGATKEESSKACALNLVKQLYRLGLIESFGGVLKKKRGGQIPSYKITVSEDFKQKLKDLVTSLGGQPQSQPNSETTEKINLIRSQNVVDFKPQADLQPEVLSWTPVIPNWNTWTSTNIKKIGNDSFSSLDEISAQLKNAFLQPRPFNEEMKAIRIERDHLPITAIKELIVNSVCDNQIVIINGEAGSGKSTQVPQFILDDHILKNKGSQCNIIIVPAYRFSAISLASRVALERGEMLGYSCGFSDKFESIYPQPYGSLLYCTAEMILRKLEFGLKGISHIIIDDFNERDSNIDFLVILLRDMASVYPQLKIILMGVSLDIESLKNYFTNNVIIQVEGRSCPVEYYFLEDCIEKINFQAKTIGNFIDLEMEDEVGVDCNTICDDVYKPSTKLNMSKISESGISLDLIEALLSYIDTIHPTGSVLIFLPDFNVIRMLYKHLSNHNSNGNHSFFLTMLHAQAPQIAQKKIFQFPCPVRKVILTTNIAESSQTINDVMFVIDFCKDAVKGYNADNKVIYSTRWVSKSNVEQRRSRACYSPKGYVFHLISKARYQNLKASQSPEICRTSLHNLVLKIKLLKLGNIYEFLSNAIEEPPIQNIKEAEDFLKELNVLDPRGELTDLGRVIGRLPIEPRMGRMIIFGCMLGIGDACTLIAAITLMGDPFILTNQQNALSNRRFNLCGDRFSDHVAILHAFKKWSWVSQQHNLSEEHYCISNGLNYSILKMIQSAAFQMKSILIQSGFPKDCLAPQYFDYNYPLSMLNSVITLLVMGLYPNICHYNGNRELLTKDFESAFVHKLSVNYRFDDVWIGSPFFVFCEKIRTHPISCKQLTRISPLQLLLFGCRKVTYQNKRITIDNWLTFDIDFELVNNILSLRPAMEKMLLNICSNPELILNPFDHDLQLITVVAELGIPSSWKCDAGELVLIKPPPTPAQKKSAGNRKRKKSDWNAYQFENHPVPDKIPAKESNTHSSCNSINGCTPSESYHNMNIKKNKIEKINEKTPKKGFLLPTPVTAPVKHVHNPIKNRLGKSVNLSCKQQDFTENDFSEYYYDHSDASQFSSELSGNSISRFRSYDKSDTLHFDVKSLNGCRSFSQMSQKLLSKNLSINSIFPVHVPFSLLSNGALPSHPIPKTYEKNEYMNILQSESQKSIVEKSTRALVKTRPWYDHNDYENVNKSDNVLDAYKNTKGFLKISAAAPVPPDNPLDAYENTKSTLKSNNNKELDDPQNPILSYELPNNTELMRGQFTFLNPRRSENIRGRYLVARQW